VLPDEQRDGMQDLLAAVTREGTGRAAQLRLPTYGKTGTTQDNRDAWFVGWSEDLVAGVWMGNDDGTPMAGVSGGGLPTQVWRDFMLAAVPGQGPAVREPARETFGPRNFFRRWFGWGGRGQGHGKGKKHRR
jgi:penicillin-binding protein 1A